MSTLSTKPSVLPNSLSPILWSFYSSGRKQKAGRHPVRLTLPWKPAPLLCKRLNIPVPTASAELNWARKDRLFDGNNASPPPEQDHFQSMRKFVPDSSAARPRKVRIVQRTSTGSKHRAYS